VNPRMHRSGITASASAVRRHAAGQWLRQHTDRRRTSGARHREAAEIAASMVRKPYRYGGNTPQGFDCSGLVYFSFKRAGMDVPRSTGTQRGKSRKVSVSGLARGDLLFFNQDGKYSSHVGIYLGDKRFVHAPSSGKRVRVDSLTDTFWQKHLVDTRRF